MSHPCGNRAAAPPGHDPTGLSRDFSHTSPDHGDFDAWRARGRLYLQSLTSSADEHPLITAPPGRVGVLGVAPIDIQSG
jgi:hypothetical protein